MAACNALNTTQFHPFSRLPKELRDRICIAPIRDLFARILGRVILTLNTGQATLEPRIVYVHAHLLLPGFPNRIWSNKTLADDTFFDLSSSNLAPRPQLAFKSNSTVPIILYVCRESRDVATRVYSLAFGHSTYPRTWFDFMNDTLLVDWRVNKPYGKDVLGVAYDAYLPEDLGVDAGKVKRLAVYGCPSGVQKSDWGVEILEKFNDLEILKIIDRIHNFEDSHSANLTAPDFFTPPSRITDMLKKSREDDMAVEEELEKSELYYRFMANHNGAYTEILSRLQKDQMSGAHISSKIPQIQVRSITSRDRYDECIQAKKLYDIEQKLRATIIELDPA